MQRRLLGFLLLTVSGSVLAADLIVGTWKMNVEKSQFNPGPGPKSVTVTYSEDGDWLVSKADAVDANGTPATRTYRFKVDGKEYPYEGPQGKGTISIKRMDERHATETINFGGGSTQTREAVMSEDGKTRTVTAKGTNAKGESVNYTYVWERQ